MIQILFFLGKKSVGPINQWKTYLLGRDYINILIVGVLLVKLIQLEN